MMYCCISYPGRLLGYRRIWNGASILGTCRRPPGGDWWLENYHRRIAVSRDR